MWTEKITKVKVTASQLGIINTVLQVTTDKQPRQYEPLVELPKAQSILRKIIQCTESRQDQHWIDIVGGDGKPLMFFVDGEIIFTTEEKMFLIDLIKQNKFTAESGDDVADLLWSLS